MIGLGDFEDLFNLDDPLQDGGFSLVLNYFNISTLNIRKLPY